MASIYGIIFLKQTKKVLNTNKQTALFNNHSTSNFEFNYSIKLVKINTKILPLILPVIIFEVGKLSYYRRFFLWEKS